jgi:hypothetical protein
MKNPFPPRDPPTFIQYGNVSRGLAIWRGHERLVIKKEDLTPDDGLRAGDFGITSDNWVFVIRDSDHVAVLQVSSCALNGRLLQTPAETREKIREIWCGKKEGPQELMGILDFCTSYPTDESEIRGGSVGNDCKLQVRGKHFCGDSTVLGAEPFLIELDTVFMQGPPAWWTASEDVVRENLLVFEDVWEHLYLWFREQRRESREAAHKLPIQCEQIWLCSFIDNNTGETLEFEVTSWTPIAQTQAEVAGIKMLASTRPGSIRCIQSRFVREI